MSWDYYEVSKLWQQHGWIDAAAAKQARLHYGAYSVKNHYGLRMITFNSDFWYHCKYLICTTSTRNLPLALPSWRAG